jgi:hypothetical protein
MGAVLTLPADEGWCVRCGRCGSLDRTGRCRECSYMTGEREPDALDNVLAEIEVARELAADAGLPDVYAALVRAGLVLAYVAEQLRAPGTPSHAFTDYPRAS